MASNSFGELFRFTTWGESHGKAIGCVIDGCPSGVKLSESDIQGDLDRRKPGQSKYTTQRAESDTVEIMSGVFEGKTTGTPISLVIYNEDQRSKDYGDIKDKYRPSHADYVYDAKYGIRDYRGGGRSSARETAMRVAAGAVAKKVLQSKINVTNGLPQFEIIGYIKSIGEIEVNNSVLDFEQINSNPFFSPDPNSVDILAEYVDKIRKSGSSVGATIEIVAKNVPIALGEPIYRKLDSEIAKGIMSINAVKSVEIGLGSDASRAEGVSHADEMSFKGGQVEFSSNNAGGILGGISTGQDIVVRFSVKPTSSILTPRNTVDKDGNNTSLITKGRHDPCVGIRAVPIGEAMVSCVLADMYLNRFGYI